MTHEEKKKEWCKENGETYSSLRRWKEIIEEKKQTEKTSNDKWVSLDIPAVKVSNKPIKISINEFTVEIEVGFNKDLLAEVFKVLKTV